MDKIKIYLVDDLAAVREEVSSDRASSLIQKKGYHYFKGAETFTENLGMVKVYIKPDSIAIMAVSDMSNDVLKQLYNDIIFFPLQVNKQYYRIIRKGNNPYPVFLSEEGLILLRTDYREKKQKLEFDTKDLIEVKVVTGQQAMLEIHQIKENYAKDNRKV